MVNGPSDDGRVDRADAHLDLGAGVLDGPALLAGAGGGVEADHELTGDLVAG